MTNLTQQRTCTIVPQPRQITPGADVYSTTGQVWNVPAHALANPAIAHKLASFGIQVVTTDTGDPLRIYIGEQRNAPAAPQRAEGYALHISSEGVTLHGTDMQGLFWGLVTLEQLLLQDETLTAMDIIDWPEIAFRCHHDDISRKQVSTVDDFKRIIHYLSTFKINHYALYIEDMLHLESYPDIGDGRGKLLPNEVREIVREGELHNITVMPSFQLIGHQENLLANPKYAYLGREVFHSMSSYDPDKPEVREFLTSVIADVCALFPSRLFLMGFDETQGVTKEQFIAHANWCAEQLQQYGKTPMMWVDMIYNHFGYETVKELHPAIIPGNWSYAPMELPIKHQAELEAQGRNICGYGGYSNWCVFLPDSEKVKTHLQAWASHYTGRADAMLACTQWGDNGYENMRDLPWNLFAYFGEAAWSGPDIDRATFEARFQLCFYGAPLPELTELLRKVPATLAFPQRFYWQMHRLNANGMFRMLTAKPESVEKAKQDIAILHDAMLTIERCCAQAKTEQAHFDHYLVSLQRCLLVCHRLLFAAKWLGKPVTAEMQTEVQAIIKETAAVKAHYERVWLRHNKHENIEVSLAVFDEVAASYRAMLQGESTCAATDYQPLDLTHAWTTYFADINGLPIGDTLFNGIPYRFADLAHTHLLLNDPAQPLSVPFTAQAIRDIHLVACAPKPNDEIPAPVLRVELRNNGETVYAEDLLSITHLCDWWAPLGEHMWAGGGYRYVDRTRVEYLFSPNVFFGVLDTSGFAIPAGVIADELVLTPLAPADIILFAITITRS